MTDTTNSEATTDASRTDEESTGPLGDRSRSGFTRFSSADLRGLLDRLALAALVLLALIAGWSFYAHTGTAIRTWLDPAYQPIALAVFNLIVLLAALAGVAHQLYRIRAGDDGQRGDDGASAASSE